MLERWARKGTIPMYSGLIDELHKCAEEIAAINRRPRDAVGGDKEIQL